MSAETLPTWLCGKCRRVGFAASLADAQANHDALLPPCNYCVGFLPEGARPASAKNCECGPKSVCIMPTCPRGLNVYGRNAPAEGARPGTPTPERCTSVANDCEGYEQRCVQMVNAHNVYQHRSDSGLYWPIEPGDAAYRDPAATPPVAEGAEPELPAHITPALRSRLRRWANRLRGRYGVPVYLCGSALREDNPDPRDWDIRLTLPDDDFAIRFGPVDEWRAEGCTGEWTRTRFRWSDQCVKDTKDFFAWCHLNGDVQIYPASHVAMLYADKPRVRLDTFPDDDPAAVQPPSGGSETAVTDDDVARAICAYNGWEYEKMGRAAGANVTFRDRGAVALRRALEDFARRRATQSPPSGEALREAAIAWDAALTEYDRAIPPDKWAPHPDAREALRNRMHDAEAVLRAAVRALARVSPDKEDR